MGQNAKVKDRGLGSSNHGFFFAASPSSLRDTDPAQPSPPWTFPTVSPSSQFSPSPQILIFHHPYGVPTCPQATTAPGLGVGLHSSSHNTHSALHPLPSISPKINQKIILPSSRSIKGSGCPHSVLVANWNSHFSFYIFVPHSLFIFSFSLLSSVCFMPVFAPEESVITAACSRALTALGSLLPPHCTAGLEAAGAVWPFHRLLQLKSEAKQRWVCSRGGPGEGTKGLNCPRNFLAGLERFNLLLPHRAGWKQEKLPALTLAQEHSQGSLGNTITPEWCGRGSSAEAKGRDWGVAADLGQTSALPCLHCQGRRCQFFLPTQ